MRIKTKLKFAFVDEFYNYEYQKSDKIKILSRKTICISKGKQKFHYGDYWGKRGAQIVISCNF